MIIPSIKKIEEIINLRTPKWVGECSYVAKLFLDHKIVKGVRTYGHYHGYIHPNALRFGGRPFTHHAWILMTNGKICDPTRWVFENVEPYIWIGDNDPEIYDFGGNELRKQIMSPAPDFNPDEKRFVLPIDGVTKRVIAKFLTFNGNELSLSQMFWLANMPLDYLGPTAKTVYTAFKNLNLMGFIPIDNRRLILGE